jgi:tetratricopeptide (TPR) repeat protein
MSAAPDPSAAPIWVEDLFRQADAARQAGRLRLALAIYRRVVAAAPDHPAAVQHTAAVLNMLGRRAEAEAVARRAVAINPTDPAARHALAISLLAQGRYPEAGPFYRARFELPQLGLGKPSGLPYPEWSGENLAGKRLVVFPEQGYGDQIQQARFAATLRDQGAEIWLLCLPELARLFAASLPGVHVRAAQGEVDFPDPDYWTMSGDLMFLAAVTPQTLPTRPYLVAPETWPELPAGFTIGLMASGNPAHGNDANRSLPAALAEQLRASLPGRVVDLAPEASGASDFADTAALIRRLDLVVSVDTSAAHLAGALGKRALVLIPAVNTDWRWEHDREDCAWHPSLSLYRADPHAGWAPALERLVRDAKAEAARC